MGIQFLLPSSKVFNARKMKRELSVQEIEDLIVGATILGVGGGGNPQDGLKSMMGQHEAGKRINVWTLDEFSDLDRFVSPYFVGSVAPVNANKKKAPKTVDDPIRVAFKILGEKLGKKISATVATEIGGGNTAASLAIAAKLDIPAVDGDLMGRAGPSFTRAPLTSSGCQWSRQLSRARRGTKS